MAGHVSRQRNFHNMVLLFTLLVSMAISGCAPTDQVTRVEQNQSQLEYKLNQMQTDINNLKKQNFAALAAKLDQIKVQMTQLNGRLEKQEYLQANTDKKVEELNRYLRIQSERINSLVSDVHAIAKKAGVRNLASKPLPAQLETGASYQAVAPSYAGYSPGESKPEVPSQTSQSPKVTASPSTPSPTPIVLTPEQEYKKAFQLFNSGKYEDSRLAFKKFLERYPESKLAGNAQFWIGECYYKEKKYQKAINAYQTVLDKYPNGNKIKDSMLKQGMAFARIGDTTAARILFSRLIKNFPDSNQAMIAKKQMEKLAGGTKTSN